MQNEEKTAFIYVGRLDREKGVDVIIETFSQLFDGGEEKITVDFFGRGELIDIVQGFADQYEGVTYHGFQPKSVVLETRKDADYCLMPSRFLETFGLSALDSLGVGVPVIAPSKGGLELFVLPELTLGEVSVDELTQCVKQAIHLKNDTDAYPRLVDQSLTCYQQYGWAQRYKHLETLGLQQNILIVSDYGANHGGIETLVGQMVDGLVDQGCQIHTVSGTEKQLSKMQRYRGLAKTLINVGVRLRSRKKTADSDIVWRHSIHRQIGRFPIAASAARCAHWITIHDMGLLHPFPSFVEEEEQISTSSTLGGWMREGTRYGGWILIPLLFCKRVSVCLIWAQIRRKKMLVQVPAPYLVDHVRRWMGDDGEVVCVPHFVFLET